MMRTLSWKPGPEPSRGVAFVSATRFTYRALWHMPFVIGHGLALRAGWGAIEGAVGIFSGANLLERTTCTVTAWQSEADLHRWIGSARHVRRMRDYRSYLESASAVSWLMESFEPEAAWREGRARLAAARRGAS